MRTPTKKIIAFLLLTSVFSSIFYYLIISSGSSKASGYGAGLMWCPGIAALVTQFLFQGNVRGLGWQLGKPKYLVLGYAIPLYTIVPYVIVWITGLGGFRPKSPLALLFAATLGVIPAGLAALGEEIGWRGLLIQEISKITSFTKATLITGFIWAIWHYPWIALADYNSGKALWFELPCFTLLVFGISFSINWLRLKSGSLWPVVLLHAVHNIFVQHILNSMTTDTGFTWYLVDEFGIGVPIVSLVVAYFFWRKRSELPGTHLEARTAVSAA